MSLILNRASARGAPRWTVLLLLLLLGLALALSAGCSRTETTTESIPFETQQQDDPTTLKGETNVLTDGQTGEKEITWRVSGSGDNAQRTKVSEKVVKQPVNEVEAVGSKDPATGKAVHYTNLNSDFTLTITKVARNNFYGGDTLEITAHIVNNRTDFRYPPDDTLELSWPSSGGFVRGYPRLASETGFTYGHSINGGSSMDLLFDWQLRPNSSLQANIQSVDEFKIGIRGWGEGTTQYYPLNAFWIGPITP